MIEAAFYGDVAKSGLFKGEQLALIESIGKNEETHVAALTATAKKLGTPAKAPKATFPLDDAKSVLDLAATVDVGRTTIVRSAGGAGPAAPGAGAAFTAGRIRSDTSRSSGPFSTSEGSMSGSTERPSTASTTSPTSTDFPLREQGPSFQTRATRHPGPGYAGSKPRVG